MENLNTTENIKDLVKTALREHDRERIDPNAVYYINQVAKMMNSSYRKVKWLIEKGLLKTTKDGRISQRAIDDYLENRNQ